MNKKELYRYLDNEPYEYYMVTWDNHTEPLYFMHYNKVYFESPIEIRKYEMTEKDLLKYVKEQYEEEYWDQAFEMEKRNLIDGFWYEIDCPQCMPFLPNEIDNIYGISERDLLKYIVDRRLS